MTTRSRGPGRRRFLGHTATACFCDFQRGYGRVTVTPETLTHDFRVVPYVIEDGKAGAVADTV
jgi:hypothetical protein